MITLNVTYTMKDGCEATAFLNELESSGLARYCRQEKGNHSYRYFLPADGENKLFLLEKWEDEECLNAHMQTDNFRNIGQVKGKYVESTDIQKFLQ